MNQFKVDDFPRALVTPNAPGNWTEQPHGVTRKLDAYEAMFEIPKALKVLEQIRSKDKIPDDIYNEKKAWLESLQKRWSTWIPSILRT